MWLSERIWKYSKLQGYQHILFLKLNEGHILVFFLLYIHYLIFFLCLKMSWFKNNYVFFSTWFVSVL